MRRLAVGAVLWAVLLGLAGAAAAQKGPPPGFLEAYDAGGDAYNLGNFEKAWALFSKARDLDPAAPGPWSWLAKTARAQKRFDACVENDIQAMRLSKPGSTRVPEILANLAACRKALRRPAFVGDMPESQGAIAVIANVEGAAVSVDGIKKGATPLLTPFPVNKGPRQVHVEKQGYLPIDVEVDVVPQVVHDVVITMEVDPDALPAGGPPKADPKVTTGWLVMAVNAAAASVTVDGKIAEPAADGTLELAPGIHVLEVTAPGRETYRRRVVVVRGQKRSVTVTLRSAASRARQRRLGLVALGVAAAAGASGAAFGLLEGDKYEQARDWAAVEVVRPTSEPAAGPDGPVPLHTRAEIEELADQGKRYALISNVSYGVALLALGASVYFFINERSAERRGYEPPIAVVPTVSPDGKAGAQVVFTRELPF